MLDLIAKIIGYIVILLFIFCMLSFFYTEFRNRLTYEIAKRREIESRTDRQNGE